MSAPDSRPIRPQTGFLTIGCVAALALSLLALAYGVMLLGLNAAFIASMSDATFAHVLYMAALDVICLLMILASVRATMYCFGMLVAFGKGPLPTQPQLVRWGLWLILIVWSGTSLRYLFVEGPDAGIAFSALPVILGGWVKFTIHGISARG